MHAFFIPYAADFHGQNPRYRLEIYYRPFSHFALLAIILKIYLKGGDQILTTMYQFPFPAKILRFINHFDKSIHYYSYFSSQLFLM